MRCGLIGVAICTEQQNDSQKLSERVITANEDGGSATNIGQKCCLEAPPDQDEDPRIRTLVTEMNPPVDHNS